MRVSLWWLLGELLPSGQRSKRGWCCLPTAFLPWTHTPPSSSPILQPWKKGKKYTEMSALTLLRWEIIISVCLCYMWLVNSCLNHICFKPLWIRLFLQPDKPLTNRGGSGKGDGNILKANVTFHVSLTTANTQNLSANSVHHFSWICQESRASHNRSLLQVVPPGIWVANPFSATFCLALGKNLSVPQFPHL